MNITEGLYYLHENNIIHCDLKSLNVLLDDHGKAKLADFGLAMVKSERQNTVTVAPKSQGGSIAWMAPERFKRFAQPDKRSDIFELGMVLWEMASRKYPFQGEHNATPELIKEWVKDGERQDIPQDTPQKYAQLLTQCWAQRPEDRPQSVEMVAKALENIDANDGPNPAFTSEYLYNSFK